MTLRVRPHHLIDIITQYGAGIPFEPADYGHAVHTVAAQTLGDLETELELVVGADDICAPCRNLVEGRCVDLVGTLDPPVSKQEYNDALDQRLLDRLGLREGQRLSVADYARVLWAHLEGLEGLCSHPGEERAARGRKLQAGLQKMGVG